MHNTHDSNLWRKCFDNVDKLIFPVDVKMIKILMFECIYSEFSSVTRKYIKICLIFFLIDVSDSEWKKVLAVAGMFS